MKVGRRLATKLLNVTKFVPRHRRRRPTAEGDVDRPVDAAMLARLDAADRRGDRGVRRLRLRPGAGAHRGVLLVVLRRLRRAGQGRGPTASASDGSGGVGHAGAAPAPRAPPAAARPDPAVRHRGGVELVARRQRPPRAVADRRDRGADGDPVARSRVSEVLARVRRAKTEAKQSQRAAVARLVVQRPADWLAHAADRGRAPRPRRRARPSTELDRRSTASWPRPARSHRLARRRPEPPRRRLPTEPGRTVSSSARSAAVRLPLMARPDRCSGYAGAAAAANVADLPIASHRRRRRRCRP